MAFQLFEIRCQNVALENGTLRAYIKLIVDNESPGAGDREGRVLPPASSSETVMSDDLSLQRPTTSLDGSHDVAAARAVASWLVPPLLIPIFLAGATVAYALYRLVHLGLAAFN
jgi:hypothetical protein